jgi:Aspartyl/Asparaginyl beta-hydroxylase
MAKRVGELAIFPLCWPFPASRCGSSYLLIVERQTKSRHNHILMMLCSSVTTFGMDTTSDFTNSFKTSKSQDKPMSFQLCTFSTSLVLEPVLTLAQHEFGDGTEESQNQRIAMQSPTVKILTSQLEEALEARVMQVNEDGTPARHEKQLRQPEEEADQQRQFYSHVEYIQRADGHWLKVRPPSFPLDTILGIPEDSPLRNPSLPGAARNDDDDVGLFDSCNPLLHVTVYRPRRTPDGRLLATDEVGGCRTTIPPPISSWKRRPLTPMRQPTRDEDQTIGVSWIELRSSHSNTTGTPPTSTPLSAPQQSVVLPIHSQADALYFLRSLLGTSHEASPWCSTDDDDDGTHHHFQDDKTNIVVVVLDPPASRHLKEFRVGDACPSWFLHAVVELDHLEFDLQGWENMSGGAARLAKDHPPPPATLLIYKRLAPRLFLSVSHPQSTTTTTAGSSSTVNYEITVPTVSASTIGCLWETILVKTDDNHNRPPNHPKLPPREERFYRLTCPPYVNLEQEFPHCQALFEPQHLQAFTKEALRIGYWIPWPETQHYSSQQQQQDDDGDGMASSSVTPPPWTVVPLCHCFPSNQVENLQWIDLCKRQCPETCDILQRVLGTTLRTALFSQLAPHTTLEPHTGWSDLANHVLRLHIPLVVPGDSSHHNCDTNSPKSSSSSSSSYSAGLCGTWVDGCVETHVVGKPIVFDDSKLHRAFNYSDQTRIVLIVDLERPAWLPTGTATGGHSEQLDAFIQQMAASSAAAATNS